MKASAKAHSNIAFIKYWGRKDEKLRLPTNGSLSMNLSNLHTITTVEFSDQYKVDQVIIDGEYHPKETERAIVHIDRIRNLTGKHTRVRVESRNNFPSGTGLSSSSSGFAALTLAMVEAAGLKLTEKELSMLARQGSGSACRSIPSGFVEWKDASTSEESYAYSIFPSKYWDIVDIVAVVSNEKKDVPTSVGQTYAETSPFFQVRSQKMAEKLLLMKQIIADKDFKRFGELIEAEALEMHAVMLTSAPSLIYWSEGTLKLMKLVKKWRSEGLAVYFTINTGQDIHLICQKKDALILKTQLEKIREVKKIITNSPAEGAQSVLDHLF